jgi:hypothetical protein
VKPVFADTFYWIALTNPVDMHSQVASRFTTEEVLTEVLMFFAADGWLRNRAVHFVRVRTLRRPSR